MLVRFDRSNTKHGMRAIHILAVLLLLAAGAAAGAEKKACHGGDEAALLAVKAAFSNTSSFMSWTPDIPCCDWPGIDCSDDDGSGGTTGRVVSLAILRDDGITGAVPGDAIAGLTRLQILFLFKLPRVSGAIPAALARLSGLKELTISRTGVSGPVPSFLGALKALESLDLSFNALTGAIPASLGAPPRLISVDLSRNRLTGRIPPLLLSKAGPQAFLSLSHNKLSGGIPAEFAAVNFEQIDLSRNQLTGDASLLFGRGDDDKPVLDSADLSRNALSFNMSGLRLTRRLDSLDLSHNMIYGGIPAVVANLTNLQVFNVSYNRLCGAVPVGAAARYDLYSFAHNKCLCGAPLPDACR
jgi:Leucine-rich repeat (LRR) protein